MYRPIFRWQQPYLLILLVCFICFTQKSKAQATIELTVLDGAASTSCTGIFGLAPLVQWSVAVQGEAEVLYPQTFGCYTDVPHLQYQSPPYDCHWNAPSLIQVCFSAFENEAIPCNVSPNCQATVCDLFEVPLYENSPLTHTLEIADTEDSWGFVQFEIALNGSYIGLPNDAPCTAIGLGTLDANGMLGSDTQSQYLNSCANRSGTNPSPSPGTGAIIDNQGLWFEFQTGNEALDLIEIAVTSDPQNLGDPINSQVVLYKVINGDCTILQFLGAEYDPDDNDALLYENCLTPNSTYAILVDGTFDTGAGIEGYFDVKIEHKSVAQAADRICDAENLGLIPEGGSVEALLQTNNCAGIFGDPMPSNFSTVQSVWYQFAAPPSGSITITATNHLPLLGNEIIDLQLALYQSANNNCDGSLTEIASSYNTGSINENLTVTCLENGQSYWVLLDGESTHISGSYDLQIADAEIYPPETTNTFTICAGTSYTIGNSTYDTAGSYSDTLNVNGCDSIVHTELSIATPIVVNLVETIPATLATTADGAATASPVGGVPPYNFSWSNGATAASISNIPAGTYCVTITDVLNCYETDCVEITYIGAVTAQVSRDTLSCHGDSDGVLELSASGGTPPYVFSWQNTDTDSAGSGTINAENTPSSIQNLSAGVYQITITGSEGLETIINTEIVSPAPIISEINPILCFGESLPVGNAAYTATGEIFEVLTAANGCDSTIVGTLTILERDTLEEFRRICAEDIYTIGDMVYDETGIYTTTLTGSDGCDSIVITDLLVLPPLTVEIVVDNLASGYQLSDGAASLNLQGGNGNYSIQWQDGQSQTTAGNLAGGSDFCVTVSDNIGCEAVACSQIPYVADNIATVETSDARCYGSASGNLTIQAAAGLAPFTGTLENQENTFVQNFVLTQYEVLSINDLPAGTYIFTIIDANEVKKSMSVTINQPDSLQISPLFVEMPTCTNDCDAQFSLAVSGGTGAYNYAWTDSAINDLSATDICAGTYHITVTDANACTQTYALEIVNPDPLEASTELVQDVLCYGQSNGQAMVRSSTDIQAVLWENGETTPLATQLSAGVHQVTLTDARGCTATNTISVAQPDTTVLAEITAVAEVSCYGSTDGAIEVLPSGDGSTFSYQWDGTDISENAILENLAAGIYTVTVSNERQCTASASFELSQPDAITFNVQAIDATCENGGNSGQVFFENETGGTAPYLYSMDGENFQTETNIPNLAAGTYTLTIQDVNGCTETQTTLVAPPPPVEITASENYKILLGESLTINPQVLGNHISYQWTSSASSLDCAHCPVLEITPTQTGVWSLEVTDTLTQCTDSQLFEIHVDIQRKLFIPTAFSPNGDGINDTFLPEMGLEVALIKEMMVFDRAGNLVYSRQNIAPNDRAAAWNGYFRNKKLPEGVYVFSMQVAFLDGVTLPYMGDVTLLR